jgi:hypothetical protein
MSQRSALLLSLALTVLVGFAIVANRDRLLGASTAAPEPTPTITSAIQEAPERGLEATQPNPRIVEVTLPGAQAETATSRSAGVDDEDSDDDDRDDDDGDDDRYEHEDEDDEGEDHDDDGDD